MIARPFTERMGKRSAGSRLGRNHLVPHRSGLRLEHPAPFPRECVRVEYPVGFEQLRASHVRRNLQILWGFTPDKAHALSGNPTEKLILQLTIQIFQAACASASEAKLAAP